MSYLPILDGRRANRKLGEEAKLTGNGLSGEVAAFRPSGRQSGSNSDLSFRMARSRQLDAEQPTSGWRVIRQLDRESSRRQRDEVDWEPKIVSGLLLALLNLSTQ